MDVFDMFPPITEEPDAAVPRAAPAPATAHPMAVPPMAVPPMAASPMAAPVPAPVLAPVPMPAPAPVPASAPVPTPTSTPPHDVPSAAVLAPSLADTLVPASPTVAPSDADEFKPVAVKLATAIHAATGPRPSGVPRAPPAPSVKPVSASPMVHSQERDVRSEVLYAGLAVGGAVLVAVAVAMTVWRKRRARKNTGRLPRHDPLNIEW